MQTEDRGVSIRSCIYTYFDDTGGYIIGIGGFLLSASLSSQSADAMKLSLCRNESQRSVSARRSPRLHAQLQAATPNGSRAATHAAAHTNAHTSVGMPRTSWRAMSAACGGGDGPPCAKGRATKQQFASSVGWE
eukprot:211598-Chlamydomonas_euryale.AAC.1